MSTIGRGAADVVPRLLVILAAGKQTRWRESGGTGRKQLLRVGGETLLSRAYRLASAYGEVVTVVPEGEENHPDWQGVNPVGLPQDARWGEMGKFLAPRAFWGRAKEIVLLFGDVYYTSATMDLICEGEVSQPTVYGRARLGRRWEPFGFRFVPSRDGGLVERVALECVEAGLTKKGGTFRWFWHRHTGRGDYPTRKGHLPNGFELLAVPHRGWVEVDHSDPTDDFDRLDNWESWCARFGLGGD